jgi:hypothetical protein
MTQIQASFNPTVLFNLLVGSAGAAGKRNPGPILTSIRTNLRKEIEASLPVIYLFDAEVIVDSMLAALQPAAETASSEVRESRLLEVSKFVSTVSDSSGLYVLPEISVKTIKGKKTSLILPGDPGAYEAFVVTYNKLLNKRSEMIAVVYAAINDSVKQNTVSVSELTTTVADIHARLHGVVEEIIALGTPISAKQDSRFTRVIRAAGRAVRNISTKVRKISDPQALLTDYNSSSMVLVYAQNFNAAKTNINANITKALAEYLQNTFSIVARSATTGFQAGNFSAAGHVGFVSDNIQNINTPQLQAATLILAQAGKQAPGLVNKFITSTGHANWLLNVQKDQGENVNKILGLGISLVRSQPSVFNSQVLAPQETALINNEIKNLLEQSYNDALAELQQKAASNANFHKYLVDSFKMSPTIVEGYEDMFAHMLQGKPQKRRKAEKSGTKNSGAVNLPVLALGAGGSKTKLVKTTQAKAQPVKATITPKTNNLVNLQNLINSKLQDVVSANMGDGDARNVLNYRTGRLASSVKVEALSESRAGMITAFYSYMKNPYATFSTGGRQQNPRSRDPKLLIAKSIREIAAEYAVTKLRSVNV